ncbi:MAG: Hsp20/alpha crystallin family protein [Candidatus Woesearchaeota archaeon]
MKRPTIWDEFERMHEEMDRLFSNMLERTPFGGRNLLEGPDRSPAKLNTRKPLTDMWETGNEIRAQIELPGVNKDDIKIDVKDDGLEVSVEKEDKQEEKDEEKGYYSFERSYSGFYRYFPLPDNTDKENIEASYKDGVLDLKIPKKEVEEQEKKRIEVK